MNGDKHPDLVIAAEWSPIAILYYSSGNYRSKPLRESGLEFSNGWWNTLEPCDLDRDGDLDLIAGNLGLNSKLKASRNHPVRLYVGDFDKNDSTDQILSHWVDGNEYPFYTRDEMTKQMPFLKKRFLSYKNYAKATLAEIFPGQTLNKGEVLTAYTFESCVIENLGQGKYRLIPLENAAQWSSINSVLVDNLNDDSKPDVLLGGNFYPINIQMGRNDASYGLLQVGGDKLKLESVPPLRSGFSVKGEIRALRKIRGANGSGLYLAIRNNDTVVVFGK